MSTTLKSQVLAGLVTVLVTLLLLGTAEAGQRYFVQYEVKAAYEEASVTFINEAGGTSQIGLVETPWVYTFIAVSGTRLHVTAQNPSSSGGVSVTITIWDENRVLVDKKYTRSTGAYVVASQGCVVP